jgi:hypothetical protein
MLFLVFTFSVSFGESSFLSPQKKEIAVEGLEEKLGIDVYHPKSIKIQPEKKFPILFVFDRQNTIGYSHTLHSIDYLVSIAAIPEAIVVGIAMPENEFRYYLTMHQGKNALFSSMEKAIIKTIPELIGRKPEDTFTLLIGHSRTAMFSFYLSVKHPEIFDGVIAASLWEPNANGMPNLQELSNWMKVISTEEKTHYLHFSSGEELSGDMHEKPCRTLDSLLRSQSSPALEFNYHLIKNADHFSNYGLMIGPSLFEIFSAYRSQLQACFFICSAVDSLTEVPWKKFDSIYLSKRNACDADNGYDVLFFNSMASGFSGNFANVKESDRERLTLDVLERGIKEIPKNTDFYAWAGEIYLAQGNKEKAKNYFLLAKKLSGISPYYDKESLITYRLQLDALLKKCK